MLIGERTIVADGKPDEVMTTENLSRCYGVPVRVVRNPLTGTAEVFAEPPKDDGRRAALLGAILGSGEEGR